MTTTIKTAANKLATSVAANEDIDDPFEIEQELRDAPRPQAGHTSNIVEFYRGRSVFITGASGFIGKVLIEKLLRTCSSIKRVFVLIRPKYNKQPHERLKELLASPLFDGLRKQDQHWLEQKVCLVEGDVTKTNLGLSGYDLAQIIQEVSVIFHSAATVKFDEPLKQSVAINITGTKNMINVCRRIPQLASLVHVSTAYANCDLETVDEHIYPVDMDPERLIEMADWLDQDTLQELKRRLLGAKPNTYTYTKSLAEWLLIQSARDLPVVVCRPSIVVATANEPFKGWIDNMNGPTGVVLGAGKGLIRSMYAEKEFRADLVPVDKVINLILTLGWFAHLNTVQRKLLNGELDDSLTESLLISSSACSSSSCAGSSAASTSGVDDSLQEDELHSEHQQQEEDQDKYEHDDDHHHHHHHHDHDHQDIHNHHQHHLRARHSAHHQQLGHNEDLVDCSHEDECADLSLTSESGSSSMTGDGGDQSLCQMNDEPSMYLLSHAGQQQHDDGYASRSPEYANSLASSNSSRLRRHRPTKGARKKGATVTNLAPVKRRVGSRAPVLQISEMDQTSERREELCELGGQPTSQTDNNSEEIVTKLRKFRARTLAKLADKGLSEELAAVPVFHCTSGGENPITWGQVQLFILSALAVFPSSATYRYPCGAFTNNANLDKFYCLTLHYLPAYLVDFLTKLMGGKPVLVKIFKKFDQAASVLKAFTSRQWHFDYDNRLFLMQELMNDEDRRLFDCDMKSVDWRQFCSDYVIGVRKFLLKEPMANLASARRNLRFVYMRNLCIQMALAAIGAYYTASSIGLVGRN